VTEAPQWAEYFIYRIVEMYESVMLPLLLKSTNKKGKQAIIDFIKELNETPLPEGYLKNEKFMQSHLEELGSVSEI
jgi:hypothetical protein